MVTEFIKNLDFNTILIILGGVFMFVNNARSTKFQDYKDALAGRDLRIKDLETIIVTNKAQADSDLAALKAKSEADTAAMKIEIQHLKDANLILQNTVTGKEVLEAIQKQLGQFTPYIGAFPEIMKDNKATLAEIKDIKGMLGEKRHTQDQ